MSVTMKITGLRELERNLERLSKSAGKGALRRAGRKAGQPMADLMASLAPRGDDDGGFADTIAVGTKLSDRQKKLHRKMFRDDRSAVELFIGPGPDPAAWNQEFGNINHGPQPFARPAWDQDKDALLERLSVEMWREVLKSVKRAEIRAARQAG